MKNKSRMNDLYATADAAKREIAGPATEVLLHLQQALSSMPPFVLKDGTRARFELYVSPEINKYGDATCGVDAILEDKGHLEFTVTNTGWGKSLAQSHHDRPKPRGRER